MLKLATALLLPLLLALLALLVDPILAQDMQAVAIRPHSDNPIQLTNPGDQATYISANSPTTIPTAATSSPSSSSSEAMGQIVVCTTALGTDTQGEERCETFTAMTSFSSLRSSVGSGGIMTASETRVSTVTGTRTARMTTTTGTRESGAAMETGSGSGQGSGAERLKGMYVERGVVVAGLVVVGGVLLGAM